MNLSYFIIPLCTFAVAGLGSLLTNQGMDWYHRLQLPAIAPTGSIIGSIWTIIFIFCAISAILLWNDRRAKKNKNFKTIFWLFGINGVLNIFWSFLFFTNQLIGWSIVEMIALEISVLALIAMIWKLSKPSALLLVPYAVWVVFATYLAYQIWLLN